MLYRRQELEIDRNFVARPSREMRERANDEHDQEDNDFSRRDVHRAESRTVCGEQDGANASDCQNQYARIQNRIRQRAGQGAAAGPQRIGTIPSRTA